jgi:hypothetical protein
MHGALRVDVRRLLVLKDTAEALSPPAQRDLVEYWGRRRFEARPKDWT